MADALSWASFYEKHFDADDALADYFTPKSGLTADTTLQPYKQVTQWFISEAKKADICILYGGAYCLNMLLPACDFVKEIIVIDSLETNLHYFRRWMKNEPTTFNWSELAEHIFESEKEKENFLEKEKETKKLITKVIKADLSGSGPVAPLGVPQADVIICPWFFCFLCPDLDSFTKSIKDMSSLLKVGGHLLMHVHIGCTFYYMNKVKYPVLCVKEAFLIKVLTDHGFKVTENRQNPRLSEGKCSILDFSYIAFFAAQKNVECNSSGSGLVN